MTLQSVNNIKPHDVQVNRNFIMQNNKQYFYLVCIVNMDSNKTNNKIFLQEKDAVKYGRRMATKFKVADISCQVKLFRQGITKIDNLEFVSFLNPFKDEKEETL